MVWIYFALISYFVSALVFVVDKYLLAAPIPRPFGYAFWVAALSGSAIFLIPLGVAIPSVRELLIALAAGMAFFVALVFFYRSVKHGEISVSATNAGTFTALFTALFSVLLTGQAFTRADAVGWLFLVAGLAFLSKVNYRILPLSLAAGVGFGLYYVLLKMLFGSMDYINGVFWSRMGYVAAALPALLLPATRRDITASFHQAPPKSRVLFVTNKALVGAAFLLLYYAIKIGNVVIINALLGFQFVFVLVLALIFHRRIPEIAESVRAGTLMYKLIGITLVVIGFVTVLFV